MNQDRGVLVSGEGVPPDNGIAWRFIDATWLQACAYIMVMVLETLTGILLLVADGQETGNHMRGLS